MRHVARDPDTARNAFKIAMKNRVLFAIRLGRGYLFSAGCGDF
jgi:hypothetical protein